MKLGDLYRYEIKAEAFRRMTGHMAPGKDAAAASYPAPYIERHEAWLAWMQAHGEAVSAMLAAFESVMPDEAPAERNSEGPSLLPVDPRQDEQGERQ